MMTMLCTTLVLPAALLLGVAGADAGAHGEWAPQDDFSHGGATFKVQLFTPSASNSGRQNPSAPDDNRPAAAAAPLTLCLHSSGSLGTDNELQLRPSEPCYIWATMQREPTYVLAPQLAAGRWADVRGAVVALVRQWRAALAEEVDPLRLYATGHSNGAAGVWAVLESEPGLIAAASPSSSDLSPIDAATLARTPQLVIASAADTMVAPARTRAMVEAMWAAGASPEEQVQWVLIDAKEGVGHGQVPAYIRSSTLAERYLAFHYERRLAAASSGRRAAPWQPNPKCQAAADADCASSCLPYISSSGCHGPLMARKSGPSGKRWRCYSPSTLDQDNRTYVRGHCFCTRDSETRGVLKRCGDPDPDRPPPKPPPSPPPSPGVRNISKVFASGQAGVTCYRIPAVTQTKQGTLLAFAEARHGSCSDGLVHELVCRRSSDGGRSWSAVDFVVGNASHRVSNPYPMSLRDEQGEVVLVYKRYTGVGAGGTGVVRSTDDGVTWTSDRDVSAGFGVAAGAEPGPGAGLVITTAEGKPRLLVSSHLGSYTMDYVTTSTDGETWATNPSGGFAKMDESTMADCGKGQLVLNFRHRDERTLGRGVSRSTDFGNHWTNVSYDRALVGPVCQGSLASTGGQDGVLYFSNPHSPTLRDNLTIQRSNDCGRSWQASKLLVQAAGCAGYSSLVHGSVDEQKTRGGILYESHTGGIDFATFPLNF